jgi:hypothetical protein
LSHVYLQQVDLSQNLDMSATECLNTDTDVYKFLKGAGTLKSDADAQLLFNIKMHGVVRLQNLVMQGLSDGTIFCLSICL